MTDSTLKPEDYAEPLCPLCMDADKDVRPIDARRFIDKLDAYFAKNDYDGAGRHLEYWYAEAAAGNDLRGRFTVLNEMLGYYRKTAQKEKALAAADEIAEVIRGLGMEDSVSSATVYLNIGTVYKAFSMPEAALPFFERALDIYGSSLDPYDVRYGGLYNNFALALVDLCRFDEAFDYYNAALRVITGKKGTEPDIAVTYLNMASAAEAQLGLEQAESDIEKYLDQAEKYLDCETAERNAYYAFVCDKCAPVFSYYGRFLYAEELKKRSVKIYEGT